MPNVLAGVLRSNARQIWFSNPSFLNTSCCRYDIPFRLSLSSEFSKCVSGDKMASIVEEIVDFPVSREKFLGVSHRPKSL